MLKLSEKNFIVKFFKRNYLVHHNRCFEIIIVILLQYSIFNFPYDLLNSFLTRNLKII